MLNIFLYVYLSLDIFSDRCLFNSLAHILIGLVFLLLSFKSSLYISDTSSLTETLFYVCFANTFPQ